MKEKKKMVKSLPKRKIKKISTQKAEKIEAFARVKRTRVKKEPLSVSVFPKEGIARVMELFGDLTFNPEFVGFLKYRSGLEGLNAMEIKELFTQEALYNRIYIPLS